MLSARASIGPGMKTAFVAEYLSLAVPRGTVDRRTGTVRNVRVIGKRSRNQRKYPPEVTARHVAMFGVGVNVGHHFDPRTGLPTEVPPTDRFGRLENPRVHAEGVNADLRFNPEHAFAKPFCWACENNPALYAFSVLQRVKWRPGKDADGDVVAEAILEVASVDIVTDGGTTSTIFESFTREGKGSMFPTDPKALAAQFESAGQLAGFLTDFLAALTFPAKDLEVVKAILANWTPTGGSGGGNPELTDAIDATQDGTAESRQFVRRLVDGAPFVAETPRRPPIEPGASVAALVAGYRG
jgi:hypothetical protein